MAADKALEYIRQSAGPASGAALEMLSKIIGNIVQNPQELKYRKLKLDNAKLKEGLFQHRGSTEFLTSVGFVLAGHEAFEFNKPAVDILRDALALIARFRSAVESTRLDTTGTGHGPSQNQTTGRAPSKEPNLDLIMQQPGGPEALEMLAKVLLNARLYPENDRYRNLNLDSSAGQKLLPTVPLLKLAGFEECNTVRPGQEKVADGSPGSRKLRLVKFNSDVVEKVWAMAYWSTVPRPDFSGLTPMSKTMDLILGTFLGAAIGDALGAPLGRKGINEVSNLEVLKALEMCGGGAWSVAPGQVTHNTELLVCLAESLANVPEPILSFPLDDIAAKYGRWGQSQPFHADRACRQSFPRPMAAESTCERAKDMNAKSMGAGALIRSLAVAATSGAQGCPEASTSMARADTSLSHPLAEVGCASAAYALIAAALISSGGDRRAAFAQLESWLVRDKEAARTGVPVENSSPGWTHLSKGAQLPMGQRGGAEAPWQPPGTRIVALEVLEGWLKRAFGDSELPFSDESHGAMLDHEVGCVEVPLTHAFRHLHRGSNFEDAMYATLSGGGDSCTIAGAIGGLLGAAVGASGLPPRWVHAVLGSDVGLGQFRPPEYAATRFIDISKLLTCRALRQ